MNRIFTERSKYVIMQFRETECAKRRKGCFVAVSAAAARHTIGKKVDHDKTGSSLVLMQKRKREVRGNSTAAATTPPPQYQ